ncbi:MAG: S8 family serine peptidase [Frankiaceae bacterium]|nr:S8 family serine peptidase [Frankiaceae bacterium]
MEVPLVLFRRLLALLAMVALLPAWPAGAATTTTQVPVCKRPPHGRVACLAIRVDTRVGGRVRHASAPVGLVPADLRSAYALPTARGSGRTVAIVDAYDDPTAEQDLGLYRTEFKLPACTTANGCFRKVGQSGAAVPAPDPGWAQEISLDLDMVSAVCPQCHVLLVEASSASQANLGAAVDTAARLGADAISNSYGGADASDSTYGRYYHHAGVAVTASSGDSGYGVSYPASSRWVTAVGGTSLRRVHTRRGWQETAWSGAGSGCAGSNAAPYQSSATTQCTRRAVADIAAVADPATGVAVYDSYSFEGTGGWLTFGGTSVSAPIIAAVFALAGNTAEVADGSYVWKHHAGGVNDVTSGSNGSCSTARWCTARRGWDGPTGWGTPKGIAAF